MSKYKVCVVMSTYNGEKYIKDQINSIIRQKDVDVTLYIRDDFSTDNTTKIIETLQHDYKNVILEHGERNLGFSASFLTALKHSPESDFYAFSDQDDVWQEDKLINTIALIPNPNNYSLGFLNAMLTDEKLNVYSVQYKSNRVLPNYKLSFYNSVCSGYMMVFTRNLRDLALRVDVTLVNATYDQYIGALASFFGDIHYNNEIVAAHHRRLKTSLSRSTEWQRIRWRIMSLIKDKGVCIHCAKLFLQYYDDILNNDQRTFLQNVVTYRTSYKSKINLLTDPELRRPGFTELFITKLKIAFNRF